MNIKKFVFLITMLSGSTSMGICQITNAQKDSLFIHQVEDKLEPDKVLHAEPLYIDLIRDLGARKGEKEWNVGLGITDNLKFDTHEALIEYEWAPMNRLGLEVELPFTFYAPIGNEQNTSQMPSNQLNSLKLAGQYTFVVSEKYASSFALGYINEFELSDFKNFGRPLVTGNVFNPFFVGAKRWGTNFHTLIYMGPKIEKNFDSNGSSINFQFNTNLHYMITGTRNFIGMEINKTFYGQFNSFVLRPQMRLDIAKHLMIGILAGIPLNRNNQRLSSFVRLIWEPGNKKNHMPNAR